VSTVVTEVTERTRTEEALRESEERYREVVDAQAEMVCRYLPDTTLTFVNEAYCRFFGRRREDLVGRSFLELVPPPAREDALSHVCSLAREPRLVPYEHAVVLPDGHVGWQEWVDHAIRGAGGEVVEFQGIGRDITAHKRDEEALRASYARIKDLAGRLITAQEAERARIARELHDDVNQQVAAMSIALSAIKRRLPEGSDLGPELSEVQGRAGQLAEEIRNLSHELHPGVLRHAGLAAAVQAYCNEFRTRHRLSMTVRVDEDLDPVPPDAALCLYRVAQEALGNIGRHSGARNVQIALERTADGLVLVISDDGRGFDPAVAHLAGGVGLISLDERVRLAGGTVKIDAKPQHGTTIRVLIPLEGEDDGTRVSTAGG
jgi:PAS domain S-box-containing protein